jgi:hypothetical protein
MANIENLKEFRDKIDVWNNKYSLFFSRPTSLLSARFRSYLRLILLEDTPLDIINKKRFKLTRRAVLRTEFWSTVDNLCKSKVRCAHASCSLNAIR